MANSASRASSSENVPSAMTLFHVAKPSRQSTSKQASGLRRIIRKQIVGTPDMTPAAIKAEAKAAGLKNVSLPSCNVAGKSVTSGTDARCFASYMRIHGLEATGGLTYSQMPRYASADGKGTNVAAKATKSSSGQPLDNPARTVWINETALSTALNMSYMASQLALFGIVVGVALLLTGIGFIVLAAFGTLRLSAAESKPESLGTEAAVARTA